jgi:CRISPR-associated endonuclease/helicase Cas3
LPPITAPAEIPGALLIAMPHQLVTYDKDLGLVFLDGRIALPEVWRRRLEAQIYQSPLLPQKFGREDDSGPTRVQSYRQHIGGLADAYHYVIRHELAYAMEHLESLMRLEEGTIDHAIQLAIATHDLGKLDAQWQRWARTWQRLLHEKGQWSRPYQERDPSFFFAKTDYDYRSNEQREWQKELSVKRPKHACESVMAGRRLVMHSLGVNSTDSPNYPVLRAVCSAVAHHHTPSAHEYSTTKISKEARAAIAEAFEVVRRGGGWNYDLDRLSLTFEKGDLCPVNASQGPLTKPDIASGSEKLLETWLAYLIVRALRLADQRADLYAVLIS